jgi:threonine dehydrogenase-like Zn-dependent dehydrogenase
VAEAPDDQGGYAHGVNLVDGRREHVFETALRLAAAGRVHLHEMVTHTFPLTRYQDMIEVNMRKSANRAVKDGRILHLTNGRMTRVFVMDGRSLTA